MWTFSVDAILISPSVLQRATLSIDIIDFVQWSIIIIWFERFLFKVFNRLFVCLFLRVAAVSIWNFRYGMAVRRFSLEFRYAHTKRYTSSMNVYANRLGFGSVNDLKLCWYHLRLNEFSVDINRRPQQSKPQQQPN